MLSNRQWLLSQNIYYPDHDLDINGVSSGNLRKIFVESESKLELSALLLAEEVEYAKQAHCHTIVFSSEFFFRKLEQIAAQVPEAVFIGYVRFGLEMMQSSYNQAVKRHGRTEPFRQGGYLQSTLNVLSASISRIGEGRFLLRPYSKALFIDNNIVSDFLKVLEVKCDSIDIQVGRINSSYCLESIEVKRWINQLESKTLQTQFDLALQSYGNNEPFSLFSDTDFEKSKVAYLGQLKEFLSMHKVARSNDFYELCANQVNEAFRKQELSESEFRKVLVTLLKERKLSYTTIYITYKNAQKIKGQLSHPERVDVLKHLIPIWTKVVHKVKNALRVHC